MPVRKKYPMTKTVMMLSQFRKANCTCDCVNILEGLQVAKTDCQTARRSPTLSWTLPSSCMTIKASAVSAILRDHIDNAKRNNSSSAKSADNSGSESWKAFTSATRQSFTDFADSAIRSTSSSSIWPSVHAREQTVMSFVVASQSSRAGFPTSFMKALCSPPKVSARTAPFTTKSDSEMSIATAWNFDMSRRFLPVFPKSSVSHQAPSM
mmetsp:Transcript_51529/g.156624  ORF Transcript_51529/g.156624 Transcript_51529/m.156624 type:complete len:209 (-) Transcript_51529:341-967(-)